MVVAGRHKSIAFFVAMGAGLIAFIILLYVGWVLLGWHNGILLFFGVLVLLLVIAGVVLNTTFLVREIRRNEQHDAFINAVTHELKTPIASIRLYLETLKTREVDDARRAEHKRRAINVARVDLGQLVRECLELARRRHHLDEEAVRFVEADEARGAGVAGDREELRAAVTNL